MKHLGGILILFCISGGLTGRLVDRNLQLVNPELMSSSHVALAQDGLTARTAVKRVEGLLDSLQTLRDKCGKYMFIVQNYVSFYQHATTQKLQKEETMRAKSFVSMNNGMMTVSPSQMGNQVSLNGPSRKLENDNFVQPELKMGGDIEGEELNFGSLVQPDQGTI